MVVHSRFTRAAVREGSVILDKGYYRLGRLKVESTGLPWTEACSAPFFLEVNLYSDQISILIGTESTHSLGSANKSF